MCAVRTRVSARGRELSLLRSRIQFPFSLSLLLLLAVASDGAGRGSHAALCPASTERTRSLCRARVYAHAKLRVPFNERRRGTEREGNSEREREKERQRDPAAPRGPSRWRRINRCALHLASPPRLPPRTPPFVLGCHPSATDSDLRTRARRFALCTSRAGIVERANHLRREEGSHGRSLRDDTRASVGNARKVMPRKIRVKRARCIFASLAIIRRPVCRARE